MAWTSTDPLAMSIPIQQQISALEPELPVYNVLTMDQILGKSTATQGFAADLHREGAFNFTRSDSMEANSS